MGILPVSIQAATSGVMGLPLFETTLFPELLPMLIFQPQSCIQLLRVWKRLNHLCILIYWNFPIFQWIKTI
jgi:hypothetical protein